MNSFVKQFTDYVGGRMSRKDYWLFAFSIVAVTVIVNWILGASSDRTAAPTMTQGTAIFLLLYYVGVTLLFVLMSARRLHDTNRNGWLAILQIIPCLGGLILLVFLIQAGDVGENNYGPDPSEIV